MTTTTLAKMRASRARALQTELQTLAQFRRESRAHIAAIAKAWRPLSKKLTRALDRMNLVLPDDLQLPDRVDSPAELTAKLTDALEGPWQLADVLAELRELGPKLRKIEPVKVRHKRAKLEASRKALEKEAHLYDQMRADLADPVRFENRLHNANLGQKLDRKPEYSPTAYRKQLSTWLAEYDEKRRAVGL
jgi:hypothetical protein